MGLAVFFDLRPNHLVGRESAAVEIEMVLELLRDDRADAERLHVLRHVVRCPLAQLQLILLPLLNRSHDLLKLGHLLGVDNPPHQGPVHVRIVGIVAAAESPPCIKSATLLRVPDNVHGLGSLSA